MAEGFRPTWAEVDVGAARRNAALLADLVAPSKLCAVVKADGYGLGSVAMARAALSGGAEWLAVALVEEGVVLRDAGIRAPILLLSEPPTAALDDVVGYHLVPTVYTPEGVQALGKMAARSGTPVDVHLKVDTGMHRVGADPDDVVGLAESIVAQPGLRLGALCTHLAVADGDGEEDRAFTGTQLHRFGVVLGSLARAGYPPPLAHVANSAGSVAYPEARYDLVRCGIALTGCSPSPSITAQLAARTGGRHLEPVLSLRAEVSLVRQVAAGERPSYGRRRPLVVDSIVATVPIGYADGVPRRFFESGGEVLIGGVRRPLAGVVTMDQIVVDCGPAGAQVAAGDDVVLIGRQGDEEVTATEWADRLGTINYEVLCAIGARVPRRIVGSDDSGAPGS